jgi:hypothetical protein
MEEEEECVRGTFCHDTFFFSEDGILRTLRFPPDLDLMVVLDDSGETSTLTVPDGIATTATEGGVWCNSPRLLELPRKIQLRTSPCLQISGIRRPKDRHC